MNPENIEKIEKHRKAVLEAIELYDSGYEAREEYPGKLMLYGTWDMIDVPMETWYFFRGIIFGKGDSIKRKLDERCPKCGEESQPASYSTDLCPKCGNEWRAKR